MTLITILITLVVQRFANIANWFKASWFEVYMGWLKPVLVKCNPWLAIAAVILPVFALLGILQYLLSLRLFGIFCLLLTTAVLLLCMDARNLKNQLSKYLDHAEKQETEAAFSAAAEFAGNTNDAPPSSLPALNRYMTKLILTKSYATIFAILFWFAIFGIYGASGYLIIMLLRRVAVKVDGSFGDIAYHATLAQNILDWAPVRALGMSYALAGYFMQTSNYVVKNIKLGLQDNLKFAAEAGLAALGAKPEDTSSNLQENYAALALIDRTLIVWIMVIALVTLGMLL